jgi:hypothetical protein
MDSIDSKPEDIGVSHYVSQGRKALLFFIFVFMRASFSELLCGARRPTRQTNTNVSYREWPLH